MGSFWFVRVMFTLSLNVLGFDGGKFGVYVAWLAVFLLVVEGLRHSKPLFDISEYACSGYYKNFVIQSKSDYGPSRYCGNPAGVAFLISQALFLAPRTIVLSVQAFRSLVPADEQTARDASRILSELRKTCQWTFALKYADNGPALVLLRNLKLIWIETELDDVKIRYPAGSDCRSRAPSVRVMAPRILLCRPRSKTRWRSRKTQARQAAPCSARCPSRGRRARADSRRRRARRADPTTAPPTRCQR